MAEEDSQTSIQDDSYDDEDVEMIDEKPKRRRKPGIVYLSSIPPGMNPQILRQFLSSHGEIGNCFLQPVESNISCIKKLLLNLC